MKIKYGPNRAVTIAASVALTAAVLMAAFYVATRDRWIHRPAEVVTAPPPAPPQAPPAPPRAPEPPPTPPESAAGVLKSALDRAEQKDFVEARRRLADALRMDPTPAVRREILQKMIPINDYLLKLAPNAPDIEPYRVRTGDTWERLARRVGGGKFEYGALKLTNRSVSNNLRVGDTLRIPRSPFSILVVKSDFRLYLMYEGAALKEYLIAVGRGGTNETPAATFTVGTRTESPHWYPPEELIRERGLPSVVPPGDPENPLGTHWIGLEHPSYKRFGIHGTNDERVLGTEATLGCIRLSNPDVAEVFGVTCAGMSVTIVD
jgi:hypothetical protein